jgi:hypothetical protein
MSDPLREERRDGSVKMDKNQKATTNRSRVI